jgi:transmembrane sensor
MSIPWIRRKRLGGGNGPNSAEHWFVRLSQEDIAEDEHDKFIAWLSESDEHSREWERVCKIWSLAGEAKAHLAVSHGHERLSGAGSVRTGRWAPIAWGAVGAACLAAMAGIVYFTNARNEGPRSVSAYTAAGETKTLSLAGGGTIILGVKTSVTITEGPEVRRIDFHEGEAHISTAQTKAGPLMVRVGNDVLTSADSDFALRFIGDKATIAVERGRVSVSTVVASDMQGKSNSPPAIIRKNKFRLRGLEQDADGIGPGEALILAGGEGISLFPNGTDSLKSVEETPPFALWQPGVIEIRNETEANAILELTRYYPETIRIVKYPTQVNSVSISLRVTSIQQNLEELADIMKFKFERSPHGEFLVSFL